MVETFVECSNDMSRLGKTIKMLRERSGLNQAEFAECICERTFLSKLENGARKAPSIVTLSRMCQKLNISMDDLFLLSFGDNDEILSVIVSDINALIYSDRFEDAYELASKHLSEIKNPIYKQLFLLTKALFYFYKQEYNKTLFIVEEAISLTTSLTGPLYTLTELRLVNMFIDIHIIKYRNAENPIIRETFSNFTYYLKHNYVQSYSEIGYMYLSVCRCFLYEFKLNDFYSLQQTCLSIFEEYKLLEHRAYSWMNLYLYYCIKEDYINCCECYNKLDMYFDLFGDRLKAYLQSHIDHFSKRLGRDISPKAIKELIDNE